MKNNKRVVASIIIPSHNDEKFVRNCLKSIFKNTTIPFEVIFIEGGSKDNTLKVLKESFSDKKNLKIIDLKKDTGPIVKRNVGIEKSKGEYLVFLDNDTTVGKKWLADSIQFLKENKNVAGGQLKILKSNQKNHFDSAGEKITPLGFLSERAREAIDKGQFDQKTRIFSGKTAAMIFKREVLKKVKGFDEDFFMYWEEPDICWRIQKLGYEIVFLPGGKVFHAYGTRKTGNKEAAKITYLGCRNQILTIAKNATGFRLFKMLTIVTISWITFFFLFLIKFEFERAKAVALAFVWIFKNFRKVIDKRKENKKVLGKRFYSDNQWFDKVEIKRGINWYWGKCINYILGRPF